MFQQHVFKILFSQQIGSSCNFREFFLGDLGDCRWRFVMLWIGISFSNEMRRVSCSMWRKLSKGVNPQLLNMLVNFDLRPFGGWKEFLQDIFPKGWVIFHGDMFIPWDRIHQKSPQKNTVVNTWRIIPLSKWLITMVSKFPM